MGTDIHLYIEVLTERGWELYSHPFIQRDYRLFTKMAGVRDAFGGTIEPISRPRGIPDDVSRLVKLSCDKWGSDAHSHSWLTSSEIKDLERWYDDAANPHYDVGCNTWRSLYHYVLHSYCEGSSFGPDIERAPWIIDARFVFWFDC